MCHLVLNVVVALVAVTFAFMTYGLYRAARTDWAKIYDEGYKAGVLHRTSPEYETDMMRNRVDGAVNSGR